MSQFKINILFNFINGPWGGGNQFLKILKNYFEKSGLYENKPEKADAILFNSHHCVKEVLSIKKRFPEKIIIHRVDGPIFLVRGNDKIIDDLIFFINNLLADGTVFQSNWSQNQCYTLGLDRTKYEDIIMNAADPNIFNVKEKKSLQNSKVKLIATSWSPNIRKGFDIYEYLDNNLNFKKYEMTFIGNSPIKFKNINHIKPLQSNQLAEELRKHDIYITASLNDPCSNSLIEALSCGLPAVARNSGGHPEIIKRAGEFFEDKKDVLAAIEKVSINYDYYKTKIRLPSLKEIGDSYYNFAYKIYSDVLSGNYHVKQINLFKSIRYKLKLVETMLYNYTLRIFKNKR